MKLLITVSSYTKAFGVDRSWKYPIAFISYKDDKGTWMRTFDFVTNESDLEVYNLNGYEEDKSTFIELAQEYCYNTFGKHVVLKYEWLDD